MPLKTLKLSNFRSYSEESFDLSPALTLVTGVNGSGKTNLLEGVYLLATTKSFRTHDKELAKYGDDWFRVEAQNNDDKIVLKFKNQKKFISYNQNKMNPESYIGSIQAVLFEPGSLAIINGSPEDRRRFLDGVLSSTDVNYLKALVRYRRVLKQRNALLKSPNPSRDQLFAWDFKLVELAEYLHTQRQNFINQIAQAAQNIYQEIAHTKDQIQISYSSKTPHDDYGNQLLNQLQSQQARDIAMGATTTGPHRDDLVFSFNNQPIITTASRGEMRTLVLALKLLELEFITQTTTKQPILLLDDVFSELDLKRQGYLLNKVKKYQTIITATEVPDKLTGSDTIKL